MRIRLTSEMTGTRNGAEWPPPGSVIDLPDDEARVLLNGGSAVEEGTDSPKVMVPPAGVHVPGRTAMDALPVTHLVEAPADAVQDPEGARQAYRDAQEGNVTEVPVGVGLQDRHGGALTREAVDQSVVAEEKNRAELSRGVAPKVGTKAADKPVPAVRPAADRPKG